MYMTCCHLKNNNKSKDMSVLDRFSQVLHLKSDLCGWTGCAEFGLNVTQEQACNLALPTKPYLCGKESHHLLVSIPFQILPPSCLSLTPSQLALREQQMWVACILQQADVNIWSHNPLGWYVSRVSSMFKLCCQFLGLSVSLQQP